MRIAASSRNRLLIPLLLVGAIVLRFCMLDFITDDLILWVIPWFDHLVESGYRALGDNFPNVHGNVSGNYTPPYYYLLCLATALYPTVRKLYLIKAVSVSFDFLAAGFMYGLVRRCARTRTTAWIGFFAVLFAPTVLANGALWGQCDMIPASLLLAAVYYSVVGKPFWVAVLFGAGLSFKASAIFLAPYVLMLVLMGRIPWGHLLMVPVVYALMMAPAALLGRPVLELMTAYSTQGALYHSLSMDAANLYYFVSDDYYDQGVVVGLVATSIVSLLFALLPRWKKATLTPEFLLLSATVSVAMTPFLLPKMHDRYFFAADLISIGFGLCNPRWWFVPVLFQCSSMLAYIPILSDTVTGSGGFRGLTPVAVLLNCALMGLLAVQYWRELDRPGRRQPLRAAVHAEGR